MNTQTLAAIQGDTLVQSVVWLIVAGLIFWLLTWLITYLAIPEPFNKIARAIVVIVAVVICINALLGLAGHGFIVWK